MCCVSVELGNAGSPRERSQAAARTHPLTHRLCGPRLRTPEDGGAGTSPAPHSCLHPGRMCACAPCGPAASPSAAAAYLASTRIPFLADRDRPAALGHTVDLGPSQRSGGKAFVIRVTLSRVTSPVEEWDGVPRRLGGTSPVGRSLAPRPSKPPSAASRSRGRLGASLGYCRAIAVLTRWTGVARAELRQNRRGARGPTQGLRYRVQGGRWVVAFAPIISPY